MVAELVVTTTEPGSLRGCFGTPLESDGRTCAELETQVGQQRAVIEHQQEQLMRQQSTIDAERAARTPVDPSQDARVNLVDLRVGTSRRRSRVKHTRGKVGHSRCDSTSRRWMKNFSWTRECGRESVARNALGRYERASEKTSETACVHADERSSTPDDHETERSSESIRSLETSPGRVGARTQRTVPSDADAVVAVSVYGRQRSGLGAVGTTCAVV